MPDHLQPLLIASAPNGAYKTCLDHQAIPIEPLELADTAYKVMQAGARMIHLHVRDELGKHTLDAGAYQAAIEAIRAKVDKDLFIQLTSESGGIYEPDQQRQAINAITADGVSISLRELIRSDADLMPAGKMYRRLARQGVLVQHILYSPDEIALYTSLREQGVVPTDNQSILLVLGRYGEQQSTPEILHQMIDALRVPVSWMVCAFGNKEFECLVEAVKLGGHVRVGFENSLSLRDGQLATDNHQLITQLVEVGNPVNRPLADISQARNILASNVQTGSENRSFEHNA